MSHIMLECAGNLFVLYVTRIKLFYIFLDVINLKPEEVETATAFGRILKLPILFPSLHHCFYRVLFLFFPNKLFIIGS